MQLNFNFYDVKCKKGESEKVPKRRMVNTENTIKQSPDYHNKKMDCCCLREHDS